MRPHGARFQPWAPRAAHIDGGGFSRILTHFVDLLGIHPPMHPSRHQADAVPNTEKHPVKPWFDGSGIVKKCGYLTQFHGRGNKVRKNPPKKIRGS